MTPTRLIEIPGQFLLAFGFDPRVALRSVRGIPAYVRNIARYKGLRCEHPFDFALLPMPGDRYAPAGSLPRHYFHQDLWAAREIFQRRPTKHVDIGSRIDGFIAHLLTFMDVEVVDIRPLTEPISGLRFIQDDATTLSSIADNTVESLSTLHAAEHFGLGRYGDPVDPDSWLKFTRNLQRVLAPRGILYFSVPCGRERVEFDAHRVFDPTTILNAFAGLKLLSLHAVLDDRKFYENVDAKILANQYYGCGLFKFTKD